MSLTPVADLTKSTIRRSPGMSTQKMGRLVGANIALIATLLCVHTVAWVLNLGTLTTILTTVAPIMTVGCVTLIMVTALFLAANITNRAVIKDNLQWFAEEMGVLFEEQQFMDLTDMLATTPVTPDTIIQPLTAKDAEGGRLTFRHASTESRRDSDVVITWETDPVTAKGGGEVRHSLKVEGECNTPFTSYTAYVGVWSS